MPSAYWNAVATDGRHNQLTVVSFIVADWSLQPELLRQQFCATPVPVNTVTRAIARTFFFHCFSSRVELRT